MCGIAGILNFNGRPVGPDALAAMTNAIAHRGRDSAGMVTGGAPGVLPAYAGLALGHRRLSIIDLSAQSAQPMFSSDRRHCLVYNGELYNYRQLRAELEASGRRFITGSDTEVVLQAYIAWGAACLQRFNGMFAFAIWSEDSQSLLCARDAIGIKPFYYTLDTEGFRFASESQALLNGRAALSPQAVAAYFFSMYVPRHLSIYAGVEKLLPGHALRVYANGKIERHAWWQLPKTGGTNCRPEEAAVQLQDRSPASRLLPPCCA